MQKIDIKIDKEEFKKKLDIKDGKTPIAGVDFPMPKNGKDGKKGESIIGPAGKDGSPDTGKQIVEKLNFLPKGERLSYNWLDDLPTIFKTKEGWAGQGYLKDLADIKLTNLSDGQALIRRGNYWENEVAVSTDEKVKLSASDPTAGYLDAKLIESTVPFRVDQTTPQQITTGLTTGWTLGETTIAGAYTVPTMEFTGGTLSGVGGLYNGLYLLATPTHTNPALVFISDLNDLSFGSIQMNPTNSDFEITGLTQNFVLRNIRPENDSTLNLGDPSYYWLNSYVTNYYGDGSSLTGVLHTETDPLSLHLDQTTPQTIINGIPLLESTRVIDELHELVDKKYVDEAVSSLGMRFYMTNTGSGVTQPVTAEEYYLTAMTDPVAGFDISFASLVDAQFVTGWISPTGASFTKLIAGEYNWNIFGARTAGTRTLRVYWTLVERKADDSEVVIATSSTSDEIVTKRRLRIPLTLSNDYTITAGSRIVGKIYATVGASGSAPTLTLYGGGTDNSHWETPTNTEILNTLYLQLDQTTPQTIVNGVPIIEEGLTINGLLTLDCEEELIIEAGDTKAYAGFSANIENTVDNFDTITGQRVYSIGMNMDNNIDGIVDKYKDGNASFAIAHRFYQGSNRSYEGSYDFDSIVGGIVGACSNSNGIDAVGKTLTAVNFGFYSDVVFNGHSTNGTHNANNVLISGTLESKDHNVTNGVVRNIMLWAYDDLGLGIDNAPTFQPKAGDENYVILNESVYPIVMRKDNSKMIFGAGDDAEIYYDGTNFVINPKAVGSGYLDVFGDVRIKTGADTNFITDELEVNLGDFGGALPSDLIIKVPYLVGTGYSSYPEIINVDKLVCVSQGLFLLDEEETDVLAINAIKKDFSASASMQIDLSQEYFSFNYDVVPNEADYEDDIYHDLGRVGLEWNNLYLLGTVTADKVDARIVHKTAGSDPKDATPANRPAGEVGEVIFYNGKWYGCTNSATPTWEMFTSS